MQIQLESTDEILYFICMVGSTSNMKIYEQFEEHSTREIDMILTDLLRDGLIRSEDNGNYVVTPASEERIATFRKTLPRTVRK
jgi:hypothetical protein